MLTISDRPLSISPLEILKIASISSIYLSALKSFILSFVPSLMRSAPLEIMGLLLLLPQGMKVGIAQPAGRQSGKTM